MNRRAAFALTKKLSGYLLLIGLVVIVLNPDSKAWALQRMVNLGIFNAKMKDVKPALTAPIDFTFINIHGERVALSSLRGKVVFVNFWASWCPPCRAEMPSLYNLYKEFKGDDRIVFLFLDEDDDQEKAKAFLVQKDYDIPLLKYGSGIPSEFYSGTLPTTLVLDKQGSLIYHHEGIANYSSDSFVSQLRSLL